MQTFSQEEIRKINRQIADYAINGEHEKATELLKQVPLPAYLAKAAKEVYMEKQRLALGLPEK